MAENMNFIPANELPEAVGDEIEVLCVENGQMKRKIGSLGGKGLIVEMTLNNITPTSQTEFTYNDNADEIAETLYGGGIVWVDMTGVVGQFVRGMVTQWMFVNGVIALAVFTTLGTYSFTCPNFTWTLPVE